MDKDIGTLAENIPPLTYIPKGYRGIADNGEFIFSYFKDFFIALYYMGLFERRSVFFQGLNALFDRLKRSHDLLNPKTMTGALANLFQKVAKEQGVKDERFQHLPANNEIGLVLNVCDKFFSIDNLIDSSHIYNELRKIDGEDEKLAHFLNLLRKRKGYDKTKQIILDRCSLMGCIGEGYEGYCDFIDNKLNNLERIVGKAFINGISGISSVKTAFNTISSINKNLVDILISITYGDLTKYENEDLLMKINDELQILGVLVQLQDDFFDCVKDARIAGLDKCEEEPKLGFNTTVVVAYHHYNDEYDKIVNANKMDSRVKIRPWDIPYTCAHIDKIYDRIASEYISSPLTLKLSRLNLFRSRKTNIGNTFTFQ